MSILLVQLVFLDAQNTPYRRREFHLGKMALPPGTDKEGERASAILARNVGRRVAWCGLCHEDTASGS